MNDLAHIAFEGDHTVLVARISGEIDLSNAFDLRDRLATALSNTALGMILDLTGVRYLDSAGVRLLIELAARGRWRQQQVRLVVTEASPLRRVLSIAGLDHLAPADGTVEEAHSQIVPPDEGDHNLP